MTSTAKPRQSLAGLLNISFGFFGIQIGFALQNSNMSRIFQTFGAKIDDLAWLWVAAPLSGLIVQPIIGHMSDRTWLGRFGRRRPYFLTGAVLATLAMLLMPVAPSLGPSALLAAALLLWMLDASLNISMEPFRAFVGDMLPRDQHTPGYTVQTAFIGAGAVVGSIFPYLLDHLGVSNDAAAGSIPATVRYSFWFGGLALLASVLWTILSTREYSPEEMARFADEDGVGEAAPTMRLLAARTPLSSLPWIAAGALVAFVTREAGLQKEVYLLAGLLVAYGVASMIAISLARSGRENSLLANIVGDFSGMPAIMKKLALVQFFTWSALYIMWTYTTPVVAQYYFGSTDAESSAYQDAGNWVGVMFTVYNGVAALAALFLLPALSRRIGAVKTHIVGLLCGAAGYASFFVLHSAQSLLLAEVGVGIAWASLLAMPYAILASNLPPRKLGVYMGLFNVFVVVPQLIVATVMGSIMKALFPDQPIYTMAFAAGTLVLAALAMLRVREDSSAA
ncbi:MFS transporter [Sphingomonas sp. ASV193]|uniref:MFS transporter n=1 Tax=Sphingomonas sp. ASV193 TaxID=3144405 RepID=UPI0032E89D41